MLLENVRFEEGEEGRPRAREADGGALRHLRHGRLRHGAPRRGEHARRRARGARRLRGAAARARARCARARAREPEAAAGRGRRRFQGFDQARGAREPVAKVDQLVVGGGIANTFLAATGVAVGKSLHEADMIDFSAKLLRGESARRRSRSRPTSSWREFAAGAKGAVTSVREVGADEMILDIGPDTAEVCARASSPGAGTIIWNGPLGVFEFAEFAAGTRTLAEAIAASGRSRSRAAATRSRRSTSTGSLTECPIFRPEAARSSSSSRARSCPRWPRSSGAPPGMDGAPARCSALIADEAFERPVKLRRPPSACLPRSRIARAPRARPRAGKAAAAMAAAFPCVLGRARSRDRRDTLRSRFRSGEQAAASKSSKPAIRHRTARASQPARGCSSRTGSAPTRRSCA